MKAIQLGSPGGIDNLQLVDLPDPGAPLSGEIRVRIHASSLNYHDLGVARRTNSKYFGRILMADGAGVVEAVGTGVTEFVPGDHVVSTFFPTWHDGLPRVGDFATVPGDGVDGYARELVVRPATWFTHAPKGYSHAEASTLTTAAATVWRALVGDASLKAGDTILALGTGGVSIFALQFAKAMGARVIVTSSSDAKLEQARILGADHTINYKSTPEWGDSVRNLTGGRGVDHVFELGGPSTLPQSISAARVGGHISLIGTLTGYAGDVPTASLMMKQIRLQGVVVGNRQQQKDMVKAINVIGIKPIIDRIFNLEELKAAFRYQESGQHFGKICIEF